MSTTLLLKYLSHLGLTPQANLIDIKKSFRKLAKKYHPDLNHSANSPGIFIELREAYDFLFNYYEEQNIDENGPIEDYREQKQQEIFEEWVRYQRTKVRRQAAHEAKMKYENFKKTRAYKTAQVFNKAANYVILVSGFLIIFGSLYGIHQQGIYKYSYGVKTINVDGIFTAFAVSIVGLVIVIFTYINHKNHN